MIIDSKDILHKKKNPTVYLSKHPVGFLLFQKRLNGKLQRQMHYFFGFEKFVFKNRRQII